MRISDWSSDVCSSDLVAALAAGEGVQLVDHHALQAAEHLRRVVVAQQQGEGFRRGHQDARRRPPLALALRLRRVAGARLAGDGQAHLLDRLGEVAMEARKSTRLNSSLYCASRMPSSSLQYN